jgi:2-keto-4-pentenoate hydratase
MNDKKTTEAASLLVAARQGRRLEGLPPGLVPATIEEAYAIQDVVVGPEPAGGWKVSPAKPDAPSRCAPFPRENVHPDGAVLTFPAGRPIEVEVEVAFRLAEDLPPISRPRTVAEVAAAVESVHAAIEILSSRFVDRQAVPPLAAVADLQSNAAVIIGTGRPFAGAPDFATAPITVRAAGRTVHDGPQGPDTAQVTEALRWLADHAAARRGGLRAGDVVITGARVGPFAVEAGTTVQAEIAGIGKVSFSC